MHARTKNYQTCTGIKQQGKIESFYYLDWTHWSYIDHVEIVFFTNLQAFRSNIETLVKCKYSLSLIVRFPSPLFASTMELFL